MKRSITLAFLFAFYIGITGCKKQNPIEETETEPIKIQKIEVVQGNSQNGFWNSPLDTIHIKLTLNRSEDEIPLRYYYKDPDNNQSFMIAKQEKSGNELLLKILWKPVREIRSNTLKIYFSVACNTSLLQQGNCTQKDSILLNANYAPRWALVYQGSQGGNNVLHDLHFRDAMNGLAIGEGSGTVKTYDGGLSWTRHNPPRNDNSAYLLAFTGKDTAMVNIVNNYSLFSYDGGNSFVQEAWTPPFVGHRSSGAYYLHSRKIIHTVGWKGQIAKSTDGGKTWDSSGSFPVLNNLSAIHAIGKDTLFTCGSVGFIARSTDAGRTWTQAQLQVNQNLHTLHFLNSQKGFAGGQGGIILSTDNGGNTWTSVATKLRFPIIAIRFFDTNYGLAVSSAGEISVTSDGGQQWTTRVKDNYGVYELKKAIIKDRNTVFGIQQASINTYDLSAN